MEAKYSAVSSFGGREMVKTRVRFPVKIFFTRALTWGSGGRYMKIV